MDENLICLNLYVCCSLLYLCTILGNEEPRWRDIVAINSADAFLFDAWIFWALNWLPIIILLVVVGRCVESEKNIGWKIVALLYRTSTWIIILKQGNLPKSAMGDIRGLFVSPYLFFLLAIIIYVFLDKCKSNASVGVANPAHRNFIKSRA